MDGVRSLLLPRCVTRSRNIHNNSSLSVFHWRGWAVHTCHRSRRPFNMSILSSLSSRLHNKRVPFFCPRVCQRPCQNNPLLLRLRRWRWIWQVSLMTIMVAPLVVFTCQKERKETDWRRVTPKASLLLLYLGRRGRAEKTSFFLFCHRRSCTCAAVSLASPALFGGK